MWLLNMRLGQGYTSKRGKLVLAAVPQQRQTLQIPNGQLVLIRGGGNQLWQVISVVGVGVGPLLHQVIVILGR